MFRPKRSEPFPTVQPSVESPGAYTTSPRSSRIEESRYYYVCTEQGDFEYQKSLQQPLSSCPNLRVVVETIPDEELFVYNFLNGDLLNFSKRPLSDDTRKSILKAALTGLAELHDRNIIHTDIKPNNILIDYDETPGGALTINQVRISDLEDAVLLRPGRHTPSEIYSFGVVAIYVMLDDMIFRASDEELNGDMAWWHVLRRHISYFADEAGFQGLLAHDEEENPFHERLIALAGDFGPGGRGSHLRIGIMWTRIFVV
ncbi:hypothetical protein VTK56DRAFT_9534 [Thermocarpiscus australiensis]